MKQIKEDQLIAERYLAIKEDSNDDDVLAGMEEGERILNNPVYRLSFTAFVEDLLTTREEPPEVSVVKYSIYLDDKQTFDDYVYYKSKTSLKLKNMDQASSDNYITPAYSNLHVEVTRGEADITFLGFCVDLNKLYNIIQQSLTSLQITGMNLPEQMIIQIMEQIKKASTRNSILSSSLK